VILVDTSVWINHLRRQDPRLVVVLEAGEALVHPFVIGELALGNLNRGPAMLGFLMELPQALSADHNEVLELVMGRGLSGSGIGWVDAHLLASTLMMRGSLWTLDRTLHDEAMKLGVGWAG
jgi:predicted nucleic acid-binding protein